MHGNSGPLLSGDCYSAALASYESDEREERTAEQPGGLSIFATYYSYGMGTVTGPETEIEMFLAFLFWFLTFFLCFRLIALVITRLVRGVRACLRRRRGTT